MSILASVLGRFSHKPGPAVKTGEGQANFKRPAKPAGVLVGLLAGAGPGGSLEELSWIDFQDGGQLLDDLQPNISHGPLDPAEVSPVYPRVVGQLLLRQLSLVPDAPEVRRENLA
jgi:hypothetical protein